MNICSVLSQSNIDTVSKLFTTMNHSAGTETANLATEWLNRHNKFFCGFVNGSWTSDAKNKPDAFPNESSDLYHITDPITGSDLAKVSLTTAEQMDLAALNSFSGFEKWSSLSGEARSKHLYNIAKSIAKHQQLFALIECLSSSKHLYKTKTKDVPNLIQSFRYYAGWALRNDQKDWRPIGVVCVVAEEYNNPLMSISWRVASVLAAGNAVLLLVDVKSCLSAFLLAEICSASGLPSGVLNILPVNQNNICDLPKVSKFIFTGSTELSNIYIQKAAKMYIPCEVLIPKRPTVIIYESADLHSAANGVIDTLCFNDTRTESGGCKVLIQESVLKKFLKLLEERFSKIQVGKTMSKTDISCILTEKQETSVKLMLNKMEKLDAKIVYGPGIKDSSYFHCKPALLSNVETAYELVQTDVGGPFIITIPFRTVKESIAMFNLDKKGSTVSVWTEKLPLALEVSHKLKTGVIWLNSQNEIDASSVYCGAHLSGSSVEGSNQAFFSHLCINEPDLHSAIGYDSDDIESYGAHNSGNFDLRQEQELVQQNIKLKEYQFYVGENKKGSSGATQLVLDHRDKPHACIAVCLASDVHSAISSGVAAQIKWGELETFKRSEVLMNIMENLKQRKEEFASELHTVTGHTLSKCTDEVEKALNILFYWSLEINKHGGEFQELAKHGKVLNVRFPVGVIAIQCPDENPLLSFLSLVAPALSFGNAIVAVPSVKYPTLALKMCEVFGLSGLPVGIINVISGNRDYLTHHLCLHMAVDAIWFSTSGKAFIYNSCSKQQKKVFCCHGMWNNFNTAKSIKFVMESTFCKSISVPMGEIFAN